MCFTYIKCFGARPFGEPGGKRHFSTLFDVWCERTLLFRLQWKKLLFNGGNSGNFGSPGGKNPMPAERVQWKEFYFSVVVGNFFPVILCMESPSILYNAVEGVKIIGFSGYMVIKGRPLRKRPNFDFEAESSGKDGLKWSGKYREWAERPWTQSNLREKQELVKGR